MSKLTLVEALQTVGISQEEMDVTVWRRLGEVINVVQHEADAPFDISQRRAKEQIHNLKALYEVLLQTDPSGKTMAEYQMELMLQQFLIEVKQLNSPAVR